MNNPKGMITILALLALSIYLFVQAPTPLPDGEANQVRTVPIELAFRIVAKENNIIRAMWTKDVVGKGKKSGLKFHEDWRDHDVRAGPLPALFLRETAMSLEKNSVRLSLFLGSDFPINPSNLFSGRQRQVFELIKIDHQPQFFYASDTRLYTAMFPDFASVKPCIDCHNRHPDSPKPNWVLNDIMGATTWSYPKAEIPLAELFEILSALRQGFRDAYSAYIIKATRFENPPVIGEKWPVDGYFLPSVDVFMDKFAHTASTSTLSELLAYLKNIES